MPSHPGWSSLTWMTVLMSAGWIHAGEGGSPPHTLIGTKESLVAGALTSLHREDNHRVNLQKGKHYGLDLSSRGFFTTARLEDDQGKALETFSGFAMIEVPRDGVYRLVVWSRAGSSGVYKLTMQEMPPPKPPEKLVLAKEGLTREATLERIDSRDKVRKHVCKRYEVTLSAGKTYVIDMISKKFDAFLRLEDEQGKQLAQDDDSGGGNNARLTFIPKVDGTYRIIATSYGGGMGAFTLKIREEEPKKQK